MNTVIRNCLRGLPCVLLVFLALPLGAQQPQPDEIILPERAKIKDEELKKSIVVEVRTLSDLGRSASATPLLWNVEWLPKGIGEGHFEYSIFDDTRLVGKFVSHDMALSGKQSFRTMLPGLSAPRGLGPQWTVKFQFVTKDKVFEADEQVIRTPMPDSRYVCTAVCDVWDLSLSAETQLLQDAVDIVQFETPEAQTQRSLVNTSAHLQPAEMPNDALGYCGVDVIVLTGPGLMGLRDNQLQAIRDWVDAGGSVCIAPDKKLRKPQLEFVNYLLRDALAPAGGEATPFTLGETGEIQGGPQPLPVTLQVRSGLGRVVYVARTEGRPQIDSTLRAVGVENPVPKEWRQLAAFLWKVRSTEVPVAVSKGRWDPQTVANAKTPPVVNPFQPFNLQGMDQLENRGSRLKPLAFQSGLWLLQHLIPKDVRVVPLSLVGVILVFYLLVIGPGDYALLGWLHRRRWTWVVFPIVTLGFTIGTVALSNRYMYSAVQSRALTLVDVIDKGKPARQTRLELLFTNTSRVVTTEVEHGLFTPLNHRAYGALEEVIDVSRRPVQSPGYDSWDYEQRTLESDPSMASSVEYFGRIPSRYQVKQSVPQWSPQLNRLFTIAPASTPSAAPGASGAPPAASESPVRGAHAADFNWTAFDSDDFTSPSGQKALTDAAIKAFGDKTTVYVLNENNTCRLWGEDVGAGRMQTTDSNGRVRTIASESPVGRFQPVDGFLHDICVAPARGYFSCFAQVSPQGGALLEDLPLLDPGDPTQWLLLIIVPEGDDYTAYRRLYLATP